VSEGRLGRSFLASALLHAAALALILRNGIPPLAPPRVLIPVALVGIPGGGGGAAGPSPEMNAPAPAESEPVPAPTAPPREKHVARRPAAQRTAPPQVASVPTEATGGGLGDERGAHAGDGGTAGGGDGTGGDGSGGARVAYGANPLPPYPLVARRLGKEGLVLLDVLVAADGHAADVRVTQSCGFAALDESAATTVRERWRFVPARRGGEPVAVRVTVPIRFRLDDSRG
jgi:periplasmic protein TonB